MNEFINDPDVLQNPSAHPALLREIKMECLLATENSPYIEVRANVDPTDDPTLPVFTFRVWVIGTVFAAAGSFIDTLFGYRQPAVYVSANVGQLVACGYFDMEYSVLLLIEDQIPSENSWLKHYQTGVSGCSARSTA